MDELGITLTRYKFTVDDYHRMGDAGIFQEDDRVELIDGEIIAMAPIGPDHAGTVSRLNQALVQAFAGRAIVFVQNPVRLDEGSEPQPDFAILRLRSDFYTTGAPAGPADVLLLVEVAKSSLRFDKVVKLPLYAQARIPEVWIVDLNQQTVEVHRAPESGGYADSTVERGDFVLTPVLDPAVRIFAGQVFG